ncbi:Ig-like domain-containing protein, partial [Microvirga brassicacearum]
VNWTNATVVNPKNGTLSSGSDSASVTYTPKAGFVGTDTFDYTLTDSTGHSSTATVTITVKSADTAPIPVPTPTPT